MTVEFSNTSASIWNFIQQAITSAGFIIAKVAGLDKKQGGIRSITTSTAVRQDLAISCYKPKKDMEKFSQEEAKVNVWDFVLEMLEHLPIHLVYEKSTTAIVERSPKILYDRMIAYYVQHGYPVPMDAQEFQQGLRDRFIERDGMFFTADQVVEYDEKRKTTDGFAPMGIIVSDEANGIQWLKNFLRDEPKTYQQIQPEWMQAINGVRKDDVLPELQDILQENFIKEDDGRWRLANSHDRTDLEKLRNIALLKEFKKYAEQARLPKAHIKQARIEALRAGFKNCYMHNDFETIVVVGDKIPRSMRDEDEVLLQYYDIALNKV